MLAVLHILQRKRKEDKLNFIEECGWKQSHFSIRRKMINIKNVSKSFNGELIINNLSLEIPDGKITCLVGKNGSGKTTLIRLISGIYKPTSGAIAVSDNHIGVLLGGDVRLYDKLTGFENLKYFADLRNVSQKDFKKRCEFLSEKLNFKSFMHKRAEYYSRGMKQKIIFAISVIHNPSLILLDEPSTGLDITAACDVVNFINFCKESGKTVLISTHSFSEISDLSDRIAIIKNGTIVSCMETKDFFHSSDYNEKLNRLVKAMED